MIVASESHYAAHLAPVDIGDLDVALVASYKDLVAARGKGHKRIVLMQHGIGQSYSNTNPAYPGGRDNADVGLFLVPGEHPAQRWRDAYPDAAVEAVGSPRLDRLPARVPGPLTVAVTFHWLKDALPFYSAAMGDLAKRFHVIGHGHPRANRLPWFWQSKGIEYVPDFDDVCRRADVLVFDNTSAGYEFASTGRPVVVMNSPDYLPNVSHGLRFWDAAHVGQNVWHAGDLGDAVERALEHRPEDIAAREDALDVVYAYRYGAGERAAQAIREWALG